jgi:hypothetical protein
LQQKAKEESLGIIPMVLMKIVARTDPDLIPDMIAITIKPTLPRSKLVEAMLDLPDNFTGNLVACSNYMKLVRLKNEEKHEGMLEFFPPFFPDVRQTHQEPGRCHHQGYALG